MIMHTQSPQSVRPRFLLPVLTFAAALLAFAGCSGDTDNKNPGNDTATGVDMPGADTGGDEDATSQDTSDDTSDTSDTSDTDDTDDTTDPGDTSPDTDVTPVTCTAPMTECDADPATECETDVSTSPRHCGTCGNACATGEVCSEGTCSLDCAAGTTNCDNACVDTTKTLEHCSGCNIACQPAANADPVCENSACDIVCQANFDDCDVDPNNGCEADLLASDAHCGACDNACGAVPNGQSACSDGGCVVDTCTATYFDLDGDVANGCEFRLTTAPALDGSQPPSPNISVDEDGGTAKLYAVVGDGLGTTTSTVWRGNLGVALTESLQVPVAFAANISAAGGRYAVASNTSAFVIVERHTSSLSAYPSVSYDAPGGLSGLEAFVPLDASFPVGLIAAVGTKLQWYAHGVNNNGLYYGQSGSNCLIEVDAYSICRVADLSVDADAIDLFVHNGKQYVLALVNDGSATLKVAVYEIDTTNKALASITQTGTVDTGLASGSSAYVAFLPGDATTPPGFVAAKGSEAVVGRFASSTSLGNWSEESRLTTTGSVGNVTALDAQRFVFSNSVSGSDTELVGAHSSPTTAASNAAVLGSFSAGIAAKTLQRTPTGRNFVLHSGGNVLAYTWSVTP